MPSAWSALTEPVRPVAVAEFFPSTLSWTWPPALVRASRCQALSPNAVRSSSSSGSGTFTDLVSVCTQAHSRSWPGCARTQTERLPDAVPYAQSSAWLGVLVVALYLNQKAIVKSSDPRSRVDEKGVSTPGCAELTFSALLAATRPVSARIPPRTVALAQCPDTSSVVAVVVLEGTTAPSTLAIAR